MHINPTVSIIISAYNRPRVIPYAIKSVLASDFDDWELIIVGDGCNTQTEEAIGAFTDPRIRFHNLPANTGHQSAPHNKGVELARGEFVLFLNQDDMYFPDHISRRIAFMRETGADISWSPILLLQKSARNSGPIDVDNDVLTLDGAVADGRFNPRSFIISSCWAVRREICLAVGPWLQTSQTRLSPSQEWLYRAHRQGRNMVYHPFVSVICIHSGVRRYSYVKADSPEHERAWSWLTAGPAEKLNLMHCVAVQKAAELVAVSTRLNQRQHPLRTFAEGFLERRGIHPDSLQRFFAGVAKGGWVGNHTSFTTKPPELPVNARALSFGADAADAVAGDGWHAKEALGRWSSGETADIYFSVPANKGDSGRLMLEIYGHPLRSGLHVTFTLNDGAPLAVKSEAENAQTLIPLSGPGSCHLTIAVEDPTSPQQLGHSDDYRILGFWLSSLRIISIQDKA